MRRNSLSFFNLSIFEHFKSIHLNTIEIHPGSDGINENAYPWVGEYFKNVPITLTAVPKEGYEFSHWSGVITSTERKISLSLNEDSYIKANFIPKTAGTPSEIAEKPVIYPNPAENVVYIQSSTDWKEYSLYDVQGRQVKSGIIINDRISLDDISVGIYLLQLTAKEGVKEQIRVIKK